MRCEDCFYSHKGESELFTDKLYCHRYPPILIVWPKGDGMFSFTIDYPPVDDILIPCGEFKEV